MSDEVVITIIIVVGVLCAIGLIGGMILFNHWRQSTGRNSLESAMREIEAKKAWAEANEQLTCRRE